MTNMTCIKITFALMAIFIAPLFATSIIDPSCNETSRCPDHDIFDAPGGYGPIYCEGKFSLNGILNGRTNRTLNFIQHGERIGARKKIWANRRSNRLRIYKVSVTGTCCWTASDRHGDSQEFGPGTDNIMPRIAYIRYVRGKQC